LRIVGLTISSGWDVGVVGMKAGGERELTIPAPMAYGKRKTGDIPPNSTLKFGQSLVHFVFACAILTRVLVPEVKLLSIE
jgi:FKBP-type peptidyl-prolyl cis-trans isomerase